MPGLILVHTGQGKGKTTAALGQALRAAGQGLNVLIVQFIKGGGYYGEIEALEAVPAITLRATGRGLIRPGDDPEPHRQAARQGWEMAAGEVLSDSWGLVILDELPAAIARGFITLEEALDLLDRRPARLHLLITGRDCPQPILDRADLITEMRPLKHHFDAGIPAQAGIEY